MNTDTSKIDVSTAPEGWEWRPIETAPTHGGSILLLTEDGRIESGRWILSEPDGVDTMGSDAGWMSDSGFTYPGRSFGNPEYFQPPSNPPTHWMPLPPLPRSEIEGKDGAPKLKRCPFCGHKAELRDDGDCMTMEGNRNWWIQCTQCMASMTGFCSAEEAAEEWNLRKLSPPCEAIEHVNFGPKPAFLEERLRNGTPHDAELKDALQSALKEPEQEKAEPVAWLLEHSSDDYDNQVIMSFEYTIEDRKADEKLGWKYTALYASQPKPINPPHPQRQGD